MKLAMIVKALNVMWVSDTHTLTVDRFEDSELVGYRVRVIDKHDNLVMSFLIDVTEPSNAFLGFMKPEFVRAYVLGIFDATYPKTQFVLGD